MFRSSVAEKQDGGLEAHTRATSILDDAVDNWRSLDRGWSNQVLCTRSQTE